MPTPEFDKSAQLEETRLDVVNGSRRTSYSGADFIVVGYRPYGAHPPEEGDATANPTSQFIEFGNLQTLSISTTRDYGAERPLGTSWVRDYSPGARSVAGSLVFTLFDGDSLRALDGYRPDRSRDDNGLYSPDDIPEFNIIASATNEYGQTISTILLGVRIVNSGMNIGVQDVFTEQVLSYVARRWLPIQGSLDLTKSLKSIFQDNPKLANMISAFYSDRNWIPPILEPVDEVSRRHKEIRDFYESLRRDQGFNNEQINLLRSGLISSFED